MALDISVTLKEVNSAARIHILRTTLNNCRVLTNDQIRRDRLASLVEELGSVQAVADKVEKAPAQVSQWLNASTDFKSGRPRNMSSDIARWIEGKCGKPPGWMDQPDSGNQFFSPELHEAIRELDEESLWFAENALRSHLRMAPMSKPLLRKRRA